MSSGFSCNQNNRGLSGVYVLRYERDDKQAQNTTQCKDLECICFACIFACVVGKNLKTSKLSPMADDATTQGGIGGLSCDLWCISVLESLAISLGLIRFCFY